MNDWKEIAIRLAAATCGPVPSGSVSVTGWARWSRNTTRLENSMTETSPTGRPATAPSGSGTDWITACESAHCIKVKFLANGDVLLGSTKEPGDLMFTGAEWKAFADGIVAGEFDL